MEFDMQALRCELDETRLKLEEKTDEYESLKRKMDDRRTHHPTLSQHHFKASLTHSYFCFLHCHFMYESMLYDAAACVHSFLRVLVAYVLTAQPYNMSYSHNAGIAKFYVLRPNYMI